MNIMSKDDIRSELKADDVSLDDPSVYSEGCKHELVLMSDDGLKWYCKDCGKEITVEEV